MHFMHTCLSLSLSLSLSRPLSLSLPEAKWESGSQKLPWKHWSWTLATIFWTLQLCRFPCRISSQTSPVDGDTSQPSGTIGYGQPLSRGERSRKQRTRCGRKTLGEGAWALGVGSAPSHIKQAADLQPKTESFLKRQNGQEKNLNKNIGPPLFCFI